MQIIFILLQCHCTSSEMRALVTFTNINKLTRYSTANLEKLTVTHLPNSIIPFDKIERFITILTKARRCSLSCARSIHSRLCHILLRSDVGRLQDLYSKAAVFQIRAGHQLPSMMFSMILFSSSRQMQGYCLDEVRNASFQILCNSLFTIQRRIFRVID
jgi:hypothetical protein